MDRIYPYPLPDDADPWAGLLVHAANTIRLDAEGLNALAYHLRQVGFVHNGDTETRHPVVLDVGVGADDATISIAPGGEMDWVIPEAGRSCVWIDGDAPSTVVVDGNRLVGRVGLLGTWRFDVVVGPAIHYDSLGYQGGPLDPGEWIPITEPRQQVADVPELNGYSAEELDQLIAAAQAVRRAKGGE